MMSTTRSTETVLHNMQFTPPDDIDGIRKLLTCVIHSTSFVKVAIKRYICSAKRLQRFARKIVRNRQHAVSRVYEETVAEEAQCTEDEIARLWKSTKPTKEMKILGLQLIFIDERKKYRQSWIEWSRNLEYASKRLEWQMENMTNEQTRYDLVTPWRNKIAALRLVKPMFHFKAPLAKLVSKYLAHSRSVLIDSLMVTVNKLGIQTTNPSIFATLLQHHEDSLKEPVAPKPTETHDTLPASRPSPRNSTGLRGSIQRGCPQQVPLIADNMLLFGSPDLKEDLQVPKKGFLEKQRKKAKICDSSTAYLIEKRPSECVRPATQLKRRIIMRAGHLDSKLRRKLNRKVSFVEPTPPSSAPVVKKQSFVREGVSLAETLSDVEFMEAVEEVVRRQKHFLKTRRRPSDSLDMEEAIAREAERESNRRTLEKIHQEQEIQSITLSDLVHLNAAHFAKQISTSNMQPIPRFTHPKVPRRPAPKREQPGPVISVPNGATYHYHQFYGS